MQKLNIVLIKSGHSSLGRKGSGKNREREGESGRDKREVGGMSEGGKKREGAKR